MARDRASSGVIFDEEALQIFRTCRFGYHKEISHAALTSHGPRRGILSGVGFVARRANDRGSVRTLAGRAAGARHVDRVRGGLREEREWRLRRRREHPIAEAEGAAADQD